MTLPRPSHVIEFARALSCVLIHDRGDLREQVRACRALGRRSTPRSGRSRRRLRSVIARLDAILPGRSGCLRRALMELASCPEAAGEPLHLGFSRTPDRLTGHAWLGTDAISERSFPLRFTLTAD